jgi:hypothetical protein
VVPTRLQNVTLFPLQTSTLRPAGWHLHKGISTPLSVYIFYPVMYRQSLLVATPGCHRGSLSHRALTACWLVRRGPATLEMHQCTVPRHWTSTGLLRDPRTHSHTPRLLPPVLIQAARPLPMAMFIPAAARQPGSASL